MTSPVVHLPDVLRRRIVDHCLSGLPNEGCGLIAVAAGRIVEVYPTANQDHSPIRYTVPPQEHFAALADAESRGWSLGGVFHSHPRGAAVPSSTDLAGALEPDWLYLVVGLEGEPVIRGWRLSENGWRELSLT